MEDCRDVMAFDEDEFATTTEELHLPFSALIQFIKFRDIEE